MTQVAQVTHVTDTYRGAKLEIRSLGPSDLQVTQVTNPNTGVDPTYTQTYLEPKNMTFDITSGPKITSGLSKINETWTIWGPIDGKTYREYVVDCNKSLKCNPIGIS